MLLFCIEVGVIHDTALKKSSNEEPVEIALVIWGNDSWTIWHVFDAVAFQPKVKLEKPFCHGFYQR